ncbi:MAG: 30S ribosomal protein S9 [Candidatus Komeilibacteria bacterium CG11_big_fil_rev_8_21_14_0_20_36_20]|uniref:Small ribosomal subunit protein uS9 n=1 Tax=Candidatus Komeilibacteria bacterium CG11_big_fil_rev_8_21_14_0_20_36_20 TaxID=1974477 RepID=A0A2H0NBZ6_9BACT|nr:MAG: 30S ribosomal protein S9 [Candidatus Komeilibacteria bacterium CG11_big_fil_rev_8_21_14_0_20_36_20]PIR81992.1 MAG: 30S ribosomal protein S9 [Candidatus Komeilibacteria bacterium CG10_big_fil_rev_8_21_14_0_10_36_65]PJC55530.1 MAG: 30S ribosomal protein S9 [Candidatus Komeilibacteria bacterium CG_4_9_14_0_2_um_filter_36_13]
MTEQVDKKNNYVPAVGKRKSAIARVRILDEKSNTIKIIINNKDYKEYLPYFQWQEIILQPLKITGQDKIFISIKTHGGGVRGQVDSIKHGIAKALIKKDPELRPALKKEGFLTRDSRIKERKKPGLKKARRAPQWSKR